MGNAQTFKKPTAIDIDVLARTIDSEARGESLAGQIQVGYCILKRAAVAAQHVADTGRPHPLFGDGSILAVCKMPAQFSCWNVGDPNYARANSISLSDVDFQIAMYAATGVCLRLVSNALPLATHYYNPSAVTHTPSWVTGVPAQDGKAAIAPATFDGSIGNHRFYSAVA